MKKTLCGFLLFGALLLTLAGCVYDPYYGGYYYSGPYYAYPPGPPGGPPGGQWVPGHWRGEGDWVPGHWGHWVPGHHGPEGQWIPGHWM